MEPETSVILQPSNDESMLIRTVADIVNNRDQNEDEDEEQEYFALTAEDQEEQDRQMEIIAEGTTIVDNDDIQDNQLWSKMCRICANSSNHLISIFKGEGAEHKLCEKIHKYLPIRVSADDNLPLKLCYHCAATLLAWHDLVDGCLAAEQSLLRLQSELWQKTQTATIQEVAKDGQEATKADQTDPVNEVILMPQGQASCVRGEGLEDAVLSDPERCDGKVNSENDPWKKESEEVEYVECEHCEAVFIHVPSLVNHMNFEHGDHVHYCAHCRAVYRGIVEEFRQHAMSHSVDSVPKESMEGESEHSDRCDEYRNKTPVKNPLPEDQRGIARSASKKQQVTLCELKGGVTVLTSNLHSETDKDTELTYGEEELELVKKAKQILNDRISYRCTICEKVILSKRGFLRHIRVHKGDRPCKCTLCGKCYRIKQDLTRHIKDVHQGLKKYTCDICSRSFASKNAKEDHRRIHTGERPYACKYCSKNFRTLNSIYIHNRVHTNYKPHKCCHCSKQFRNKQRLNDHLTTHTGVKAFPCEICGKSFSVKSEAVRHRAIHNEDKPFFCMSCGLKFGQKRYLRNHIRQHHKDRSTALLAQLLEMYN